MLPFFYIENLDAQQPSFTLDEDTSKHIAGVLRMKVGGQLHLTDGKGLVALAEITDDHKKRCVVKTIELQQQPAARHKTIIAISLLKNNSRFEWFLEKATELGITEIIPLVCDRTEKQHFRYNRMKNILVSAMLQSQQSRLPVLHEPVGFGQLFRMEDIMAIDRKYIAHCMPGEKVSPRELLKDSSVSKIILIGPEGDFTAEEVETATGHRFIPVSLGDTRLRTETAGMVAATLLRAM